MLDERQKLIPLEPFSVVVRRVRGVFRSISRASLHTNELLHARRRDTIIVGVVVHPLRQRDERRSWKSSVVDLIRQRPPTTARTRWRTAPLKTRARGTRRAETRPASRRRHRRPSSSRTPSRAWTLREPAHELLGHGGVIRRGALRTGARPPRTRRLVKSRTRPSNSSCKSFVTSSPRRLNGFNRFLCVTRTSANGVV